MEIPHFGGLNLVEGCLSVFDVALSDLEARVKAIAKVIPYRYVSSSKQV